MIQSKHVILLSVVIIGTLVLVYFLTLRRSKDAFIPMRPIPNRIIPDNLQDSVLRQPGPLTNITITSSNRTNQLTISVDSTGTISFTENITVIAPNNKNLPISNNNRTILTRSSYYTPDGNFYMQTTIKYNNLRPRIDKKCYNLTKGPIQKPHLFSLNNFLAKNGYTFYEVYGKEGSISLIELDRIFDEHVRQLRRSGNDLLSTRQDFFETQFFNFFGKIDRLYKPDGQINNKFLGLQNTRVSQYRVLQAPFPIENIQCQDEYTYTETLKDGEKVDRSVKFKEFEEKPFKLFNPREHGYDNSIVSDDIIRLDPVQGIDFSNLMTKFEDIPDLQNFADAYGAADFTDLGDRLPKGKKIGEYKYYGIPEKTSKSVEVNGIVRGPAKSTQDYLELTRKQYNMCKAEIQAVIQPRNQQGNACPDSQDIELSAYSYYPSKYCDWVKVGDAWCNYEKMADDKLIICEWGKLYHGTSDRFINAIMFTFSGSDDWSDVATDISFLPTEIPRINGCVHSGFYSEFLKWFPRILRYLKVQPIGNRQEWGNSASFTIKYKTPYKKIIFNGHSLGGAQAQLAAAYFRNLFILDEVDIEVASQASPYPFMFPTMPKDYGSVQTSKRLVGYFFDECFFVPTRSDPVVDIMCSPAFGTYCHTTPETPLTDYIERKWSWDIFDGGWNRCDFEGRYPRNWQPPISVLQVLNSMGLGLATFGLSYIIEKLISAMEHPLARYREKVSILCPNSNDPNAGDKKQIICDMLIAENALNPSIYLESSIQSLQCPGFSL